VHYVRTVFYRMFIFHFPIMNDLFFIISRIQCLTYHTFPLFMSSLYYSQLINTKYLGFDQIRLLIWVNRVKRSQIYNSPLMAVNPFTWFR